MNDSWKRRHDWRLGFSPSRVDQMICALHRYREEMRTSAKLYVVSVPGFVKIGRARRVHDRLCKLQVANPHELELLCVVSERCYSEERVHAKWADLRHRGEWFRASPALLDWIETLNRQLGYKHLSRRIDLALDHWKRHRQPRRRAA